jgi:hypothetical protein
MLSLVKTGIDDPVLCLGEYRLCATVAENIGDH